MAKLTMRTLAPGDEVVLNDAPDATIYTVHALHRDCIVEIVDEARPKNRSQLIDISLLQHPTLEQQKQAGRIA